MRLLYVIDSLAPGGAETSLAEMVPGLVAAGVDIHIMSLGSRLDLADSIVHAGATVHAPTGRGRGRSGNVRGVLALARELRPSLIHTTLYEADIAGRVAASVAGIPASTSIVNDSYGESHYRESNRFKLHAAQALDAATARAVARFHSITSAIATNVGLRLGISPALIDIIPRGRDPRAYPFRDEAARARVRAALRIPGSAPVILAIGRQEPQKGLQHLLHALPTVQAGLPDVVVLIAGKPGRSSAFLQELARPSGATVRFLGHRTDVADLLAAADVFCLPSEREGFGGVLLEAMAVGCPIVASDIPTSIEVLGRGVQATGVLTAMGDPSSLAEGLARVLSDRERREQLSLSGRRRFERFFTIDVVTRQMVAFFERVESAGAGL